LRCINKSQAILSNQFRQYSSGFQCVFLKAPGKFKNFLPIPSADFQKQNLNKTAGNLFPMLRDWINKKYLDENGIARQAKAFKSSKPYPNFHFMDFFRKEKLEELRKEVLKQEFIRHDKDLFSLSNTKEFTYTDNKTIKEFYTLLSGKEFIGFMKKLTGEKYLKGIDMHAHSMVQGDYLLFHDDVVEGRKIAYIAYLAKGFTPKDGGRLQLFDIKSPREPVASIIPKFGSFAGFEVSEKSVHLVEEVMSDKNRLTIGGWFYG
jgi:Rps23 Pro-64 3,4-dihydroxylase Tpa1-like proline 4-hydroxylase